MNRKETTISLAIVGMALLATIMTAMTPTQALAIDYGSPDSSYQPNGGFVREGADSSGTSENTDEESGDEVITTAVTDNGDDGDREDSSDSGYEAFQDCLSEVSQSPTEQEIQDCVDSSYGGQDSNKDEPSKSSDENDEHRTDVIQTYDQE
jgi:hypothetical protein